MVFRKQNSLPALQLQWRPLHHLHHARALLHNGSSPEHLQDSGLGHHAVDGGPHLTLDLPCILRSHPQYPIVSSDNIANSKVSISIYLNLDECCSIIILS